MDGFVRKTPEELLSSIARLQRGKLKVYVGPVSGSGKTYHMLREGRQLKRDGVDVVICAVSTLRRPETVEQLGDLERVPSIHWFKDGEEKKDLNMAAILARNPEVVLVDGLAHRNRPGAEHPTRLADIKQLLASEISVIATVNVYELEGYTETARRLTGIEAEETLPAHTLELADEVKLIDVTPETVLSRLADGHLGDRTPVPMRDHGNLGVLRELALRMMAEEVSASLAAHREAQGLIGPSGTAERILVCVQYHWNGSIYMRRGQQIAKRLSGELSIVSFRIGRRRLSAEAAAFRANMHKLARKMGCELTELRIPGRRLLARNLAAHAIRLGATRIVMGHTRRTALQDRLQGSIVNTLLRIARNLDLYLVADTARTQGGRILPAGIGRAGGEQPRRFRRLSEREVAEEIGRMKRGRLKVYIGAAPGVGKTYTMLREGNDLLKKGIDVRIGLLETHGRRETLEQIGKLPEIPRRSVAYQGKRLEEMDVEAILAQHPEVVLVDELAHTNVPGSRRKKRYEDVRDLLEAGISVITTVNVQHMESLNDAVSQIAGIRVRETVPDGMLRTADEVQLIDVAPAALRQRLREGKVYALDKVDQALDRFFRTGNLIALRELALRELADDVDERLESLERHPSLRGPWRRREVVFVCVDDTPRAERLIRRGFRTAYRLKAVWHVNMAVVGTAHPDTLARAEALERLTVQLGGLFAVHQADHPRQIPRLLADQAEAAGATQLVVGQSARGRWERWRRGSVTETLVSLSGHRDVLVVADYDPHPVI
ncbi:universal stress protein [Cohnella sp. 56]|uniref:universal stress protein n=1 Tax=Cohnella sp. 56 TaxID=3113722 RepID=UPI0030E96083